MSTSTSNELNGKKKYLETVKYMGDLRIIGQVTERLIKEMNINVICSF